jgi:heme/copper-type cytochrome/quinol oxidase subunit 3
MKPIATTRSVTGIPTGRLAVWWVIASEIVIFGGLLASYLMHRLGHPEFGTAEYAGATATYIGAFNTLVLLSSSYSAVKAHQAAEAGNGPLAATRLLYTAGGGLVFLVVKAFEWTTEISHGYTITKNAFWSFYYVAAGIHASHVIGGMIIMLILYSDVKKNKELQRVELIGNYWHFVDLVWIFLFPLLYIAK